MFCIKWFEVRGGCSRWEVDVWGERWMFEVRGGCLRWEVDVWGERWMFGLSPQTSTSHLEHPPLTSNIHLSPQTSTSHLKHPPCWLIWLIDWLCLRLTLGNMLAISIRSTRRELPTMNNQLVTLSKILDAFPSRVFLSMRTRWLFKLGSWIT
jgi:hypothetical protein